MNEATEVNLEVLQPSAIEAMERASVDVQVTTAHKFPRSLELFKKRALQMSTLDTETAESCIYLRPVGKKDGKMQYAEGASIRMAEIVAASYGNIRIAARIIEQTERYVKCEGVAHDLESNYAAKSETMETTVTREGRPFSEGMRAVVAKACLAKAFRDACFKVVPRALCKSVYDAAKNVANGKDQPISERIKRVQAWIVSLKIGDDRVFSMLEVKGWSEVTSDHLIKLTGIKTAMSDGDLTIDDAFPPIGAGQKGPEATGLQQSQTGAGTKKPEPAKTTETAKEKPKEAPKPAQEPAGASTPAQQPSQPTNVATAPSSEQPTPAKEQSKTSPATDQNEEAKVGLAPVPAFQRDLKDTDEVSSIKFLAYNAGFTEEQVMVWAKSKGVNLAKEAQKSLNELSTAKLLSLGKAWQNNPAEFAKNIKAANGI